MFGGRLNEMEAHPEAARFLRARERTSLTERGDDRAPFIPLSWPISMLTRHSTPVHRYPPPTRADFDQNLAVDDDDIETSPLLPEAVVAIRKVARDDKRKTSGSVNMDEIRSHLRSRK
ncbi:hypothetical protein B0J13DRAFT_163533 [Dactylonectria estremocensis]|uniref:Uncharacterized protein n=1 Tax=Dactylonectria estremocensis TaxID=1079267 RepID=A0A9P9DJJ7_9HYPO|nr:hypothetical protein B0J13DRAFT_163533 [Dactylonectria estremocensis]